jgi:hypothetical protein
MCHDRKKQDYLPLSTFVIDIPRRGVRITRKQSDEVRNFIKLRLSPSLSPPRMAAAFRSISDDLHEDVDEFCESRRDSFLKQMQFLNIFTVSLSLCKFIFFTNFSTAIRFGKIFYITLLLNPRLSLTEMEKKEGDIFFHISCNDKHLSHYILLPLNPFHFYAFIVVE